MESKYRGAEAPNPQKGMHTQSEASDWHTLGSKKI